MVDVVEALKHRYSWMGTTVLPDRLTSITPIRGLGCSAFNFSDGLYPINLLSILIASRLSSIACSDSLVGELSVGHMTYVIYIDLEIHRSMYEKCLQNWYLWNLQAVGQVIHVGKHSYIYKTLLQDGDSKELFATFYDKVVIVSIKSQTMASIPKNLRGLGIKKDLEEETKCSYTIPEHIPLNAVCYDYTIMYSDTDAQGHTNTQSYNRIFLDFATTTCYQGAFEGFGQHLREYQVSRILSHYAKESMFTDQVHVHVWQDTSYHMLLHCAISRNNVYIYYGDMMFCEAVGS